MERVNVISIGKPAKKLLTRRSTGSGVVHSVFKRAINLQMGDELLTLGRRELENMPYGLLVQQTFNKLSEQLKPGHTFKTDTGTVLFPEAGLCINFLPASVWDPQIRPDGDFAPSPNIESRLEKVKQIALKQVKTELGLGYLLHFTEMILRNDQSELVGANLLHRRAMGPLKKLTSATKNGQKAGIVAAGEELIGLGPGLTPSGDDILAGFLSALILAGDNDLRAMIFNATQHIAQIARRKTTQISGSLLKQVGQGYCTERFLNLLNSIVFDEWSHYLSERTHRLLTFGATSGQEVVLGLILGLSVNLDIDEISVS